MGQCQTIIPKITTDGTWKSDGYSMVLHHDISKYADSNGVVPPGWHLFIHEVRENFTGAKTNQKWFYFHLHHDLITRKLLNKLTLFVFHAEINMKKSGRVEYMYINVNEEIEIKLTAQHFKKMSCTNDKCTNDNLHSAVQCVERCFWRQVTEKIQCRGPWMPGLDLPLCNNYTSMRKLFINYDK